MATVDSLDIQISAEVNKANASITTLSNRLDRLIASLSGVNSRGLATLGAGVNKLTNAMKNFSANTKTADFSRLSENLETISKIDMSNISKTTAKISELSKGIDELVNTSKRIPEISKSINKIKWDKFSGLNDSAKKAEQAVYKITNAANSISHTKLSFDTSDINGSIEKIRDSFGKIGSDLKFSGGLDKIKKEINDIIIRLEAAEKHEGNLTSTKTINMSDLQLVEKTIVTLGNRLGVLEDLKDRTEEFHQTLSKLRVPEVRKENLVKLENELEKAKQKIISLKTELSNKLTMGKITASVDDSGYIRMREQIALTGKTISALQDRIKAIKADNFSDISEKVSSVDSKVKALKEQLNNLKAQGFDFGDTKFDKTYTTLQKTEQELKQYKAALAQPSTGLDEDIKKTNSLGNKVEELRQRLKDLKAQGLNLGDAKFDKTYMELNKTERELKEYKNTLSGAGKEASRFAAISLPNFNKVTNAIKKMGSGIASAIKRFGSISIPFKSVSQSSDGLAKKLGKLFIAFQSLRGAANLAGESIALSSDLAEVQNVIDVSFGKYKKSIEDFSKISISNYGMSELTAKEMAGRFQAMGVAVGFSQGKMADMSVELTKLAGDMASFYNVEQKDVARSLQSVFTGETEPLELAA